MQDAERRRRRRIEDHATAALPFSLLLPSWGRFSSEIARDLAADDVELGAEAATRIAGNRVRLHVIASDRAIPAKLP